MQHIDATNQHQREIQRAKILDAARKVFAHKGKAATMADVAAEAAVSQGLAYRYFANKEAIFRALIEQALQANPATLSDIQEMPGTPGERLALLVSKLVENRREHPEFHQLLSQVLSDKATSGELRELVRERMQLLQDLMRHLIIEGQASGEVATDDPDQMITAFFACLVGLTRRAIYGPEQFHFPETAILLRILMPSAHQS
ncbi:TetR family transcriptional regulator [Reticulibacter mediterranei]|uniref:TetR family transcriptional regulator n=1 Tax=Reticulibacter mediterranei TaxID=2778369 RepID=A0A8J3N1E4_9CHLR|nr:TetR/AcrR family transcriptional regulator [Reticulibacter mediterranei]GHO95094.1 TetR family transcriptional regulator [Reticulibacter mediterranei]